RDASLSLDALLGLGFTDEAQAFRLWLGERIKQDHTVTGEPLQIMYRVDGDPHLTEETLDHLEGYRGSAPVRIGNGAAGQLQLDIYGEALHALSHSRAPVHGAGYDGRLALARGLARLTDPWDRPARGLRAGR